MVLSEAPDAAAAAHRTAQPRLYGARLRPDILCSPQMQPRLLMHPRARLRPRRAPRFYICVNIYMFIIMSY